MNPVVHGNSEQPPRPRRTTDGTGVETLERRSAVAREVHVRIHAEIDVEVRATRASRRSSSRSRSGRPCRRARRRRACSRWRPSAARSFPVRARPRDCRHSSCAVPAARCTAGSPTGCRCAPIWHSPRPRNSDSRVAEDGVVATGIVDEVGRLDAVGRSTSCSRPTSSIAVTHDVLARERRGPVELLFGIDDDEQTAAASAASRRQA